MYFCTYVSATLIVLVNLCPYKFGRFILPMILQVLPSRLSGQDVFTQKKSVRLAKRLSQTNGLPMYLVVFVLRAAQVAAPDRQRPAKIES